MTTPSEKLTAEIQADKFKPLYTTILQGLAKERQMIKQAQERLEVLKDIQTHMINAIDTGCFDDDLCYDIESKLNTLANGYSSKSGW